MPDAFMRHFSGGQFMREDKVVSEVLGGENAITPSDLYSQEFGSAMMGYAKDEVDNFLERVADAFEHLNKQHSEAKKTLEAQRDELDTFRAMENTLRDALVSSEKFSANVLESAKSEASALLEQARLSKARAELDAAKLSDELKLEIQNLKAARDRLRGDLQMMLDTHAAMLARIPYAESLAKADEAAVKALAEKMDATPAPSQGIVELNDDAKSNSTQEENL